MNTAAGGPPASIAILNAEVAGNLGAEAMLRRVLDRLADAGYAGEVHVEQPPAASAAAYYDALSKQYAARGLRVDGLRFVPKKPLSLLLRGFRLADGRYTCPPLAIDIGGLAFTDSSGRGNLRNLLRVLPFALRRSRLMHFTQDFGPMRRWTTRALARIALGASDAIWVRSPASMAAVRGIGLPESKLNGPFPDMTIGFKGTNELRARLRLEGRRYAVVAPSTILYARDGDRYLDAFIRTAQAMPHDWHVVVAVHTFSHTAGAGDVDVTRALAARLQDVRACTLVDDVRDARALKGLVAGAQFVLSSRFHALVAALSSNVPCIAVGWNPKYESLLSLYGWERGVSTVDELLEAPADEIEERLRDCVERLPEQLAQHNETLVAAVSGALDDFMARVMSSRTAR